MKMKYSLLLLPVLGLLLFCGCKAVHDADRPDNIDEGTVVFTRPARYTMFFGSYSISEFMEVVYERDSRNDAGQLVVEVGIRNRGLASWTNWPQHAPSRIILKARCNFYREKRVVSPIAYSTNQSRLIIGRGETYAYKAVCPVADVSDYQLVLGD